MLRRFEQTYYMIYRSIQNVLPIGIKARKIKVIDSTVFLPNLSQWLKIAAFYSSGFITIIVYYVHYKFNNWFFAH